ncbi:MAG TPA: MYXO-CTERM sorting domain-containing protein, partial [Polyangiaceae bacterium]
AWTYSPELPASKVDAFEVESGGYAQAGFAFTSTALYMWDQLLNDPAHPHIAAIGGSDDHSGGDDSGQFQSAIGNPTTYVMADELSVAGIMAGVEANHTYVKMQDMHDPDVELVSEVAPDATNTVAAKSTILTVTIRGGFHDGVTVHMKKNGDDFETEMPVTSDPFTFSVNAPAPPTGEDRYRVELFQDEKPRVETSHIFVKYDANGPDPVASSKLDGGGCSASSERSSSGGFALAFFASALALVGVRRRKR